MKFSTRATYGLKALLYLANQYGQRAVSVSQIAKEEGISASYLEQILHRLKKKQWIKSLRGPSGGYVLAKKPSDIKIGPLLYDLEGTPRSGRRVSSVQGPVSVPAHAASLFWKKLSDQNSQLLDKTTLRELIDEARSTQKIPARGSKFSFSI